MQQSQQYQPSMNFCLKPRPLQAKHKNIQAERHHFSVFSIFMHSGKAQSKIAQMQPFRKRKNGGIPLEDTRKKVKSGLSLIPMKEQVIDTINLFMEYNDIRIRQAQVRKNTSCRDIKSSVRSLSTPKEQKSKQEMKNYFKHLNLQAQNHSSFIGGSALLHKRQARLRIRNKEGQEESKTYRNGYESVIIKSSPKDQADPLTCRSFNYQFCTPGKKKPTISPWEGYNEADNAGPSIQRGKIIRIRDWRKNYVKTTN